MSIFNTYKKTGGVAEEKNMVAGAINVAAAPFSWDADVLVTQSNRALTAIVWGVVGVLGGEALGHMRSRDGKNPLLPVMRG